MKKRTPTLTKYWQTSKRQCWMFSAKKFPNTEISCRYFHLTQSFNRKINEIGLKTYYENFPEFNLALRMLPALVHVPPAHVKASFELVIEEITDVIEREQFEESVLEKMDELAIYFKSTYIENPIVNKIPPFPIEIWNQYDAAGYFCKYSFFVFWMKCRFCFFFAEKQSLREGIFDFLSWRLLAASRSASQNINMTGCTV